MWFQKKEKKIDIIDTRIDIKNGWGVYDGCDKRQFIYNNIKYTVFPDAHRGFIDSCDWDDLPKYYILLIGGVGSDLYFAHGINETDDRINLANDNNYLKKVIDSKLEQNEKNKIIIPDIT